MTWTKIFIERAREQYHWVYLTNDDNMDGQPDDRIAITQGTCPTIESALAMFGKSRMVDGGRKTDVYVNGLKVKNEPKPG